MIASTICAVSESRRWSVVVRDDSVNTFYAVVYAVRQVCDLEMADAVDRMWSVHHGGSAQLVSYPDREQAETTAAQLQVLGLHATVKAS